MRTQLRIQTANMGPAEGLFNIRQGDQCIEEYTRNFFGVANDKTCLMIIFWAGLAEPFKSRMPYWVTEKSLEAYINLALNLSGSAFRVELTAEPAPLREPTEPAPFREHHRIHSRNRSSQVVVICILLCWPRLGTPVCLFHSTGLAHHPYPRPPAPRHFSVLMCLGFAP